jgi:hypothetical protein
MSSDGRLKKLCRIFVYKILTFAARLRRLPSRFPKFWHGQSDPPDLVVVPAGDVRCKSHNEIKYLYMTQPVR